MLFNFYMKLLGSWSGDQYEGDTELLFFNPGNVLEVLSQDLEEIIDSIYE